MLHENSVFPENVNAMRVFKTFLPARGPPGDPGDLRELILAPLAPGLGSTAGFYGQELTVPVLGRFCRLLVFLQVG